MRGKESTSKKRENELIERFRGMPWEVWLHRRFSPFVTYLMMTHATPAGFKSQGIIGQFPIALYDTDDWYSTSEMLELARREAERYLKEKDVFTLTKQCEAVLERGRREMPALIASDEKSRVLFEKALELIKPANVYVWVAHAAESYYHPVIRKAFEAYVAPEDLETFIGDISFPSKKNAFALLEDDARAGTPLETLYDRYSWIKARGGFRSGYTMEEMQEIQEKILHEESRPHSSPDVPPKLAGFVKEVQELVYLRTLRTDVLYELYHRAQPIFNRFATELGIESLKDYIPDELLAGNFEAVPYQHAMLKDGDQVVIIRESIVSQKNTASTEIKGVIAFRGFARGRVRLVHVPSEADTVEAGDIIVTNMTTPAYISAMYRAGAFVTNEGGITCHAAILARELKKPCIIGTKIATQVLKDGDVVEVDAEKGIVRKLS